MSEKTNYHSVSLFDYTDTGVTQDSIKIGMYWSETDKYINNILKMKFSIYNYQTSFYHEVNLSHSHVLDFLTKSSNIISLIGQKENLGFVLPTTKKTLSVGMFKEHPGYSGIVIRLAISEKTDNVSTAPKIIMPYTNFVSILEILKEFRSNYLRLSTDIYLTYINRKNSPDKKNDDIPMEFQSEPKDKPVELDDKQLIESHDKFRDLNNFVEEMKDKVDLKLESIIDTEKITQLEVEREEDLFKKKV